MRRQLFTFAFYTVSLSLCLTACGESNSGGNDKDTCNPATFQPSCKNEMYQNVCKADGTLDSQKCDNGCDAKTGTCKDVDQLNCATGTNQKPYCEGNISHFCQLQQEKTLDCQALGCNPTTGACNCEEGTYDCLFGNLRQCQSNTWTVIERCGADACDAEHGKCLVDCADETYTCEKNVLKKCENKAWIDIENCQSKQCNANTQTCDTIPDGQCIEDTYACDKDNNLTYCYEGEPMELLNCGDLKCRADLGGCYDTSETCKSGYSLCDEENEEVVWVCEQGHWLYAPENECDIGEVCTDGSGGATCAAACTERCTYDGLSKIVCSETGEASEEACTLGCVNANCIDETCNPANFTKTCRTPREKLVCNGTKVQIETCGDDEMCVDGECLAANKQDVCEWSGSRCSSDKRYTQNCIDGTASGQKCDPGFACSIVEGSAKCVAAYTGSEIVNDAACTDDFMPFCNDQNQTVQCINHKISIVNCGKKLCEVSYNDPISVTCRAYTGAEKLNIGDKCNQSDTNNGTTFCYGGDIPVQCNDKGYLDPVDEDYAQGCKKLGKICAVSDVDGVPDVEVAGCYDPCAVEGAETYACVSFSGTISQLTYTCYDLGDGQLGLDSGYGLTKCPMSCVAGRCVNTVEIPHDGESCDLLENKYCINDATLVECQKKEDDEGNEYEAIGGTPCKSYEKCTTFSEVANCRQTCDAGAPDRSVCTLFLTNEYVMPQKCTAVGDGSYVYVDESFSNWTACPSGCTNGVCDD